ncbi:MAG TPA: 30S ribosomal protein S6 [Candidatus Paceibacterota bacterium]
MAKDKDAEMRVDEALEDAGLEARVYELGFHLDPELPIEEVKKAYQMVRGLIESKGAVVVEGEPQKVQLAYTISRQAHSGEAGRRDFDSAYFAWVVYETTAENHAEIISAASADKPIIRFIDLLTTKDAARHSAEMREIFLKTTERVENPEEVAVAELDAALEHVIV